MKIIIFHKYNNIRPNTHRTPSYKNTQTCCKSSNFGLKNFIYPNKNHTITHRNNTFDKNRH